MSHSMTKYINIDYTYSNGFTYLDSPMTDIIPKTLILGLRGHCITFSLLEYKGKKNCVYQEGLVVFHLKVAQFKIVRILEFLIK